MKMCYLVRTERNVGVSRKHNTYESSWSQELKRSSDRINGQSVVMLATR